MAQSERRTLARDEWIRRRASPEKDELLRVCVCSNQTYYVILVESWAFI